MEINQFQLTIPNLDSDNDTDMVNTSINNQNNNINSDSQNINNFIQNNSDNLSLTDVPHDFTNSTTTELVLASSSLDTTTTVSIHDPQFNPQNLIISKTQNLIINKNSLHMYHHHFLVYLRFRKYIQIMITPFRILILI